MEADRIRRANAPGAGLSVFFSDVDSRALIFREKMRRGVTQALSLPPNWRLHRLRGDPRFGLDVIRLSGALEHRRVEWNHIQVVMAVPDPAIRVDPRAKPGDDEIERGFRSNRNRISPVGFGKAASVVNPGWVICR
jgi:hypothetical protein